MPPPPPIPEAFTQHPLFQSIIRDPGFTRLDLSQPKHQGHNPFWFETLSNPRAVRARCFFYRTPPATAATPAKQDPSDPDLVPMECRDILLLGPDLIGQQGILHGGFLATLMDEGAGILIHAYALDGGIDPYTVTLNVTYKKPVAAPGVVLVKGRVVSREGRKIRCLTELVDESGQVCVRGESLFVAKRASL